MPSTGTTAIITASIIVGIMAVLIVMNYNEQQALNESLVEHKHIRLFVFDENEEMITVPANIGINAELWYDRTLDEYGIGGLSPMHTHAEDNIIHIEANTVRNWTFGEFLDIWGNPLPENVLVFSDHAGQVHTMANIIDYRNHVLQNGETIHLYLSEQDDFQGPRLVQ